MKQEPLQPKSSISASELSALLHSGQPVDLIDVRSPAEYWAAHIPGAKLLPLDELNTTEICKQRASANKPLHVVCQSGARAGRAVEQLVKAGLKNCVLVSGGTDAWVQAGFPVNSNASKVLPLMRQVQITVGTISAIGAALALAVNPMFAAIPLVMGLGLLFAGVTGMCGLAFLLARMPWNKVRRCENGVCCETAK